MQHQGTPRKRFHLRGFALGFLSLLAFAPAVHARPATSEPVIVTCRCDALSFDSSETVVKEQWEFSLLDDFGSALEDSVEMFRVDIEQLTFAIDQVMVGPTLTSKAARKTRPNISPPLLV
jgi:hypothetical protein